MGQACRAARNRGELGVDTAPLQPDAVSVDCRVRQVRDFVRAHAPPRPARPLAWGRAGSAGAGHGRDSPQAFAAACTRGELTSTPAGGPGSMMP